MEQSRQVRRRERFAKVWEMWRVYRTRDGELIQAPMDYRGLIPRRARRSIARAISKGKLNAGVQR